MLLLKVEQKCPRGRKVNVERKKGEILIKMFDQWNKDMIQGLLTKENGQIIKCYNCYKISETAPESTFLVLSN